MGTCSSVAADGLHGRHWFGLGQFLGLPQDVVDAPARVLAIAALNTSSNAAAGQIITLGGARCPTGRRHRRRASGQALSYTVFRA